MCGIGGILRVWSPEQRAEAIATPPVRAIPEAWLDLIDESIKHRGPDGRGRFRDRSLRADGSVVDVALVHRRLSIIDHAGGGQPMLSLGRGRGVVPFDGGKAGGSSASGVRRLVLDEGLGLYERDAASELVGGGSVGAEGMHHRDTEGTEREFELGGRGTAEPSSSLDGRVCVVFNGCIYNHRELRAELQAAGHVFSTDHSDTEVLVHGWREWEHELFGRLDGMYAVVIWDAALGRVIAARDRFGEKPLYVVNDPSTSFGMRALSSSLPGLYRLRRCIPPSVTEAAGDQWHFIKPWIKFGWNQGVPVAGCTEVTPGLESVWPSASSGESGSAFRSIGDPLRPSGEDLSLDDADRLITRAIRSRLEADVPLATFLSGGLDSAIITYQASRVRPGIEAFTVRMPSTDHDESVLAEQTARAIGVRHHVLECEPEPAADLLLAVQQLGLPFGDSSLLPSMWVSRAAKRHVQVALAGDGGDEMFLGYDRHRAMRWLRRFHQVPKSTWRAIAEHIPPGTSVSRKSMKSRLSRLIGAAAGEGYKELVAIFPNPLDVELGLRHHDEFGMGAIWHNGLTLGTGTADEVLLALRFDRHFYLPCDLLRKSDSASMSVALEVRSPFLQFDLARACCNAPLSSLMPRGRRKGLLRQVARKYLPPEIVDRPKMGFAIPIGEWFRSDYGGLRTMLLDHLNSAEPFGPPSLGIELNMDYVRQMLDEHLGTGPSGLVKRDHSQRLYMLLVLSIWAKWLGGLNSVRA